MKKTNKKQKNKKTQKTKENKTNTTRCACSRELHRQILFFSKHSSQPTILAPFLLSLRPASCMAKQRSTNSNKKIFRLKYHHNFFLIDLLPFFVFYGESNNQNVSKKKFVGVKKNENQTSTKSQQNVTMWT